uniref:Uncharacterized protein n=1 Tax=Branchiostoma floridae TaxID=7739 RepID=C3ZE77_BRAFL|eukprot:XP_002593022.1 hypothetical protein BRAFLDRAFT_74341 [Branchiostoma floridae]
MDRVIHRGGGNYSSAPPPSRRRRTPRCGPVPPRAGPRLTIVSRSNTSPGASSARQVVCGTTPGGGSGDISSPAALRRQESPGCISRGGRIAGLGASRPGSRKRFGNPR